MYLTFIIQIRKREHTAMDLDRLSPYIRLASETSVKGPYLLKEREIFDYDLIYIYEGSARLTVNGTAFFGQKGDLFFLKPKQRHSIYIEENVSFTQLHIHFDLYYQDNSPNVKISFVPPEKMTQYELTLFREDVCSAPPLDMPNHIRFHNPLYIEKMFLGLIQEYKMKTLYYDAAVKGLFINLWIYLLREYNLFQSKISRSYHDQITQIAAYLHSDYSRTFTTDELARMANLSTSYFIHLFKKRYGLTPARYHSLLRIEKAKELIQFTNQTIEEIGRSVGFNSIHSFCRAFKSQEGFPPTYFRK